jgi:hypothetical protein
MLTVIIATQDSERALVPTLAALVSGATAGLVREVILADAGSRDATAEIADLAGCQILVSTAPPAERLVQAAWTARAPWLLFLTPGTVLQSGWEGETFRFLEEASRGGRSDAIAAVFSAVSPSLIPPSLLRKAMIDLAQVLGLSRRASHGLLIGKDLYRSMGGHAAAARTSEADATRDIIRRLGRRRIVTLRCGAVGA